MSLKESLGTAIRNRLMGGLFAASVGVVMVNEGISTDAYQDGAGVWTICYGETHGVKRGQHATKAECDAQLKTSLAEHSKALEDLPKSTPDTVILGSLDMAYNIGIYGFKNSSVHRYIKAGDFPAASAAVLRWRYITKSSRHSPGKGWTSVSYQKWRFDCSLTFKGKPNNVCWGLWKRRQWQSAAIGLQYKTPEEALEALKLTKR